MKNLYDFLVQFFSGLTWSEYIAQGTKSGSPENAITVKLIFQQDNYLYAAAVLLALSLFAVYYYYFILNRKNGSGYGFKIKYWLITLLVVSLLVGLITIGISAANTSKFSMSHPFKFSMALGITNALYAVILFFLVSLLFKRFSTANRTPF